MKARSLVDAFREFGFWLLVTRAPRVIWRELRVRLETFYWRLFLKSAGNNVRIGPGARIHRPANVSIGNNVIIGEKVIIGSENASGTLRLEDGVQINRLCQIDHSGDTVIGTGTLISEEVHILSHSHGYDPRSVSKGIPKSIGPHCWIGLRSIIGEHSHTIAKGVIIAAGAVVVQACDQPDSIYGGVPAKWIKRIEADSCQ